MRNFTRFCCLLPLLKKSQRGYDIFTTEILDNLVLRVGGQLELAFLKMFLDILQKKLLIIARIQILQQSRGVRLDLS